MPILLSDKEYLDYLVENELFVEIILNNNLHNRKAQLKKVVEWLDTDCDEHPKVSDSYGIPYYDCRSECADCLQSLKEELD